MKSKYNLRCLRDIFLLGDDNKFDANKHITYSDLQKLVVKQMGNTQTLKEYAQDMFKTRFHRSDLLTGAGQYPTKAEIAYTVVRITD